MASNFIPPASHQVLNPDGTLTLPWRQFFQNVYQQGGGASGNTSTIAALQAAVAALQGQVAIDATSAAQAVSAATQALTQSQYAGVALALASVADESEYSSSGSSGGLIVSGPSLTAPPTVRGSSASLYNSAAPVVSFPAGTIVGDFVVVFIESAFSVTSPTGWTVLDNSGHGSTSFGAFTKIMTSADISAGGVTINCGGGYNGVWACVSFQNATGGVRAFASNFSGSSPIVATTSGSPMAGDYEIVFGGTRGANSTVVSSDGTVLQYQAAVGQDASGAIYGRTLSASGAVSPSVAFSVIDAFTSAGVYVVVVEGGPGVVSQSVTEIDFSGAPVAVSYPVTGKAAVAITGSVDIQSGGADLGNATAINFTGAGVTASLASGIATVSITGSATTSASVVQVSSGCRFGDSGLSGTMTLSTAATAGNYLIMMFTGFGGSIVTPPSGFGQITSGVNGNQGWSAYIKKSVGGETSFSASINQDHGQAVIYEIANLNEMQYSTIPNNSSSSTWSVDFAPLLLKATVILAAWEYDNSNTTVAATFPTTLTQDYSPNSTAGNHSGVLFRLPAGYLGTVSGTCGSSVQAIFGSLQLV